MEEMMKTLHDNLPEPVPQCGAGESRTCRYCETVKTVGEMKSANQCKRCYQSNLKAWRAANGEKVKAHLKAWRAANPEKEEKRKARLKAWRDANPEKVKARSAQCIRNLENRYIAQVLGLPVSLARQFPELIQSHREVIALKRRIETNKKKNTDQ